MHIPDAAPWQPTVILLVKVPYREKTVRIQFYRCALTSGVPSAIECADLEWIKANQLDEFVFPPADAALLGELKSLPELWE